MVFQNIISISCNRKISLFLYQCIIAEWMVQQQQKKSWHPVENKLLLEIEFSTNKRLFLNNALWSAQVAFTHLRVGLTYLNFDLYIRHSDSEQCECGHTKEHTAHYLPCLLYLLS